MRLPEETVRLRLCMEPVVEGEEVGEQPGRGQPLSCSRPGLMTVKTMPTGTGERASGPVVLPVACCRCLWWGSSFCISCSPSFSSSSSCASLSPNSLPLPLPCLTGEGEAEAAAGSNVTMEACRCTAKPQLCRRDRKPASLSCCRGLLAMLLPSLPLICCAGVRGSRKAEGPRGVRRREGRPPPLLSLKMKGKAEFTERKEPLQEEDTAASSEKEAPPPHLPPPLLALQARQSSLGCRLRISSSAASMGAASRKGGTLLLPLPDS